MVLVDSSVGEEPAPPPGGTFLQALRDDRDKTLDGFVRAIFKNLASDAEVAAMVNGAKRMSVDQQYRAVVLSVPAHALERDRPCFQEAAALCRHAAVRGAGAQSAKEPARHRRWKSSKTPAIRLFVDEPERFNALILQFAESLITALGVSHSVKRNLATSSWGLSQRRRRFEELLAQSLASRIKAGHQTRDQKIALVADNYHGSPKRRTVLS